MARPAKRHEVFDYIFLSLWITAHTSCMDVVYVHSLPITDFAGDEVAYSKTEIVKVNAGVPLQ
jgi:hypothetical protein